MGGAGVCTRGVSVAAGFAVAAETGDQPTLIGVATVCDVQDRSIALLQLGFVGRAPATVKVLASQSTGARAARRWAAWSDASPRSFTANGGVTNLTCDGNQMTDAAPAASSSVTACANGSAVLRVAFQD